MGYSTSLVFKHFIKRLKYAVFNRPSIKAKHKQIGKNVIFGKNVKINSSVVKIGDGCILGNNLVINADHFELGDYGIIYQNCYFPGGKVIIGNNFWLGADSIIDGTGTTTIGNNVGIGAQSQLWSHILYGDMLIGCQFNNKKPLNIQNDVWLVGHNLVSPVNILEGSMAMLGSVITKDMQAHRTYAGVPAKDETEKLGTQFKSIPLASKYEVLNKKIEAFGKVYNIPNFKDLVLILENQKFEVTEKIQIDIIQRTYKKTGSNIEYYFILFLLPEVKLQPVL